MVAAAESALSWALALVCAGQLAHAGGLVRAEARDGAVPLIIEAIGACSCPASLLTPLALLPSGALLSAGAAAALALEEETQRSSRLATSLSLYAALSLIARTAAQSAVWPETRWINAPTLALSAAYVRPRKLHLGSACGQGVQWYILPSLGTALLGALCSVLPAGWLARGCFECVGAAPRFPAAAIREAGASTLLLGLSSMQLSRHQGEASPSHGRSQQSLALATAVSGLSRAWQLLGASGQGMRPLARILVVSGHAATGGSSLLWLGRRLRPWRRRAQPKQAQKPK